MKASRKVPPHKHRLYDAALALRLAGFPYNEISRRLGLNPTRSQLILRPPKEIRLAVFRRARSKCQRCKHSNRQLHIHHRKSEGIGAEKYNAPGNLLLLCNRCHGKEHGKSRSHVVIPLMSYKAASEILGLSIQKISSMTNKIGILSTATIRQRLAFEDYVAATIPRDYRVFYITDVERVRRKRAKGGGK